jgi:hypothetical protein
MRNREFESLPGMHQKDRLIRREGSELQNQSIVPRGELLL